ncbi:hypothetical protein ACG02S_12500 [Roseateles sp. DC23W]|uniref:Outer membrane efflux protein n=1 Tax=Pelomonas dachongensis TaxID=3299029 RepID=A0ABW7EMM5_9BURK
MQLDLNSVESIVAWWQVWPERHDVYLDYKLSASPEFAPAILAAQRRIAASRELMALYESSVQEGRVQQAQLAEQQITLSARELRYREFAMMT